MSECVSEMRVSECDGWEDGRRRRKADTELKTKLHTSMWGTSCNKLLLPALLSGDCPTTCEC